MIHTIHNSNSLQERIDRASVGSTIKIDQLGEYEGPFIIDTPITLVGQKQRTPFWRRKGPVFLIKVAGVTLRNLVIELTQADDMPAILYIENCQPNLIDVQPIESHFMSERNLIDLGKLKAGQDLSLQFEFSDSFPFDSFENPLPGYLEIVETRHNQHTQRVMTLDIHTPKEAGYIADALTFKNEQTTKNQRYLITGKVNDSASISNLIALRVNPRNGRIIYLPASLLELSEAQLKIITGETTVKAGRSVYLMADNQGENPFLWIPFSGGNNVTFGDKRLYPWTRRPLDVGNTFSLSQSSTQFEVIKIDRQPLTFNPPGLNFENVVDSNTRLSLQININQRGGAVKNLLGLGTRRLTAASLVPWLHVNPTVEVDANGGKLEVALTPDVLRLSPNMLYLELSAIALYDNKEVYFLPARLTLNLAEYGLRVENMPLKFEDQNPIYAGELPQLMTSFQVQNTGQKSVTIEILQKPEWMEIATNMMLPNTGTQQSLNESLPSGETAEIGVQLNPQKANRLLPFGDHDLVDAIKLRCIENNQEFAIGIKINVKQGRKPLVRIERTLPSSQREFNLDAIHRVVTRPADITTPNNDYIARRVRLKNHGPVSGHYQLTTSHPALIFFEGSKNHGEECEKFNGTSPLQPGEEAKIIVLFQRSVFRQLQVGNIVHLVIDVTTSKDGQTYEATDQQTIDVRVVNKAPEGKFEPSALDLGNIIQNQDLTYQQEVLLTNTGDDGLEGYIEVNQSYRRLVRLSEEGSFTLAQKASLSFEVTVDSQFARQPLGDYHIEDMVTVRRRDLKNWSDQRPLAGLSMHWMIEAAEPRPQLHSLAGLWFGEVNVALKDGVATLIEDQEPMRELTIGNYGHEAWEFKLHIDVPWLETDVPSGSVLAIPPHMILRLPVRITHSIKLGKTQSLTAQDAIRLESLNLNREPDIIAARVLFIEPVPEIQAEPNPLMLGKVTSGQRPILSQKFTLHNHGNVDWLYDPNVSGSRLSTVLVQRMPTRISAQTSFTEAVISWNSDYPALNVKQTKTETDEVHLLDVNNRGVVLHVQYEIYPAKLDIRPQELSISTNNGMANLSYNPFNTKPAETATLTISNRGEAPFLLTLDTNGEGNLIVPHWLTLDPPIPNAGLLIPEYGFVVFTVTSRTDSSFVGQADIIVLQGDTDLRCRVDVS